MDEIKTIHIGCDAYGKGWMLVGYDYVEGSPSPRIGITTQCNSDVSHSNNSDAIEVTLDDSVSLW